MSRLLKTVQRVVREVGPTLPGPEGATLTRMEILEASKGKYLTFFARDFNRYAQKEGVHWSGQVGAYNL